MTHHDVRIMAHLPGLVWGYDFSGGEARPIREDELDTPAGQPPGLRWLHLNLSDQRTLRWLATALPERMTALLLAPEDEHAFLLEGDMLGLALQDIEHDFQGGDPRMVGLRVVIGPSMVITARRHPVRSADRMKRRIEGGARPDGPADTLELVLASLLEVFRDTTTELEAKVQEIEDEMLKDLSAADARQFITLRALMVRLRRTFTGLRNLLRRLEEEAGTAPVYGQTAARAVARLAALDADLLAAQGQLRLLRDELDLQAAQQTNRNLYFLSILTALLMPATLITGIFGMNTGGLIWISDRYGSLWATGLAAGTALIAYLLLRLSGFIRR